MNLKSHIGISLSYFFLAALLGLVLRAFYFIELPITYRFFVHTHSHIALLGWVYLSLTTLIYAWFAAELSFNKKYQLIFWATQITLAGMLFTFPFQGYGLFSIIFSTLFLIVSYAFTRFIFINTKVPLRRAYSYKCIKMALGYMVISSIGPWALGGIMVTLGPASIWYRMAIYFYLHFQYNGWMVMGLLGLFLYVFEQYHLKIEHRSFQILLWSLNLGIILSFFLSTLWVKPSFIFYVIGCIGAIFQCVAFLFLTKIIRANSVVLRHSISQFQWLLLRILGVLILGKLLLQLLTSLPFFANLASLYIDFTIGYLHWTFLGVVSIGLFFLFDFSQWISLSKRNFIVYLIGFILTEGLIFYKGMATWQGFNSFTGYYPILALASFIIVIGLLLILKSFFNQQ